MTPARQGRHLCKNLLNGLVDSIPLGAREPVLLCLDGFLYDTADMHQRLSSTRDAYPNAVLFHVAVYTSLKTMQETCCDDSPPQRTNPDGPWFDGILPAHVDQAYLDYPGPTV